MKFDLQMVEAMAMAYREKGLDLDGERHFSLEWDEISGGEFQHRIVQMEAALAALCVARPEIAPLLKPTAQAEAA
jgi:hypothetical protein